MLGASEKFNAETMDSEDPLFILYTSGLLENQRNPSYYSWIYDHIQHILLKMFFSMIMKIFIGVQQILDG